MLRRLLVAGALTAAALIVPTAAAIASADASTSSATASCYKRVGNHWNCITPGAYCPATAHGKYGYAKVTSKRYRCSYYTSDRRWHWKRA
ncbi:hypothetical protein [Microbispora sp. GKU 823]|uniref:hypothetical protein n=1 Tax=Microbispora sp. GKU 823 TaxID=1652100 RepID=UPI0009A2B079|nr:hypothetical protein [Microbispora sp. GKU 823]OPG10570.1 hypothetical protein B1L11_23205 [Microbispora sp. GKU 823]